MSNRTDTIARDILGRIHQAVVDHDVTYDEFQAAKQWLIDVGEAGEWPLFLDVFVESAVEQNAFRDREGSQGTILGPYHLPDAPFLEAPFELPRRADEVGEPVLMHGRVLDPSGAPIAGAVLDVWQADAEGLYSGFAPDVPAGNLRGKVVTGEDGGYEVRTVMPGPYTIPQAGPTGALCRAAGWSPWRPAHVHLIVEASDREPLITQIFFADSEYLDDDVATAVKDDLVVTPQRDASGELSFSYDFRLAPARVAASAA
ncbi:MAG TPA: dioxygenase [Naasia sp.]|jgi:catechol 1,2-dioxygenase